MQNSSYKEIKNFFTKHRIVFKYIDFIHMNNYISRFILFSSPIPDIILLKDNTEILGHFSLSVDEVKGIMGGIYSVKKDNDSINLQINPQKGWQPMPGKLWIKTYLWNCDMKIVEDILQVKSKWSRIK